MRSGNNSYFFRDYTKAMREGNAALFVGAGLSKPAGFVDWKTLLRDIAQEMGLDVNQEGDLIALAQYHVNKTGGRARLNQVIVDEFTKDNQLTENHKVIAQLPIRTIWTTNYDALLEDAYSSIEKRVDTKSKQEHLAITVPSRDVTIYKMHGDVSSAHEAVLTKEDYEAYSETRPLFAEVLKGDLLSKTFLFLGFSFEDPNIDYILGRIRVLLGSNKRQHYCVMKRIAISAEMTGNALAEQEYKKRKLELRVADLKRYSIEAILVDDYSEVTDILNTLLRKEKLRDVFVSGSGHEFGDFSEKRALNFSRLLGSRIVKQDLNLVSGLGYGIGSSVLFGALEECVSSGKSIENKLKLRPFPQGITPEEKAKVWTSYRRSMLSTVGFAIFIAGNKLDPKTGQTVLGLGTKEEFDLAKASNKYLIPIGVTGYRAQEFWTEMNSNLEEYYEGIDVKSEFAALGDKSSVDEVLLEAIFGIIAKVQNA